MWRERLRSNITHVTIYQWRRYKGCASVTKNPKKNLSLSFKILKFPFCWLWRTELRFYIEKFIVVHKRTIKNVCLCLFDMIFVHDFPSATILNRFYTPIFTNENKMRIICDTWHGQFLRLIKKLINSLWPVTMVANRI